MLFRGLTEEEEHEIIERAQVSVYQPQETIFHKGEETKYLHILKEGMVAICDFDMEGSKKIITNITHEGDMFGEVFFFLKKRAYEHDAIAMKTTKVLKISGDLLQEYPTLKDNLLSIFAQKAYVLNRKVRILSATTLREKILLFLEANQNEKGEVELHQSREELANYLNVTRPSLSRELMKMQEEGMIQVEKGRIKLNH